jgi:hypothetical protein
MIEISHYADHQGRDMFARWLETLDRNAVARVEKKRCCV